VLLSKVLFSFLDNSIGENIRSRFWDFGDGQNSISKDPFHTYESAGSYNVVLTITDNDNQVDTFSFLSSSKCQTNNGSSSRISTLGSLKTISSALSATDLGTFS